MRAERGHPWMRPRAAAERAQGGTRVRAVTHHAEGLFMAVPLWSWLELWCVMPLLSLLQTNVHGSFVRRMPGHVAQAVPPCLCVSMTDALAFGSSWNVLHQLVRRLNGCRRFSCLRVC